MTPPTAPRPSTPDPGATATDTGRQPNARLTALEALRLRLRKTGLVLVLVLAPVVVAELSARLLIAPQPIRRVYDPFAYRIPQPLLVDEFMRPDGQRVEIRLNELGMRGPSVATPPPADALTVVFLGGSTTENYPHHRADTFPELIGSEVEARLGRPIRVLNAGMSAATTSTSLARLQHQLLDLEPSLVVVMHGINELFGGLSPDFQRDGRHLPRPATADTVPRSYLWDWIRRHLRRTVPPFPERRTRFDDFGDFAALDVFARNIRSMAAIATAHGIPILFLSQPTMYREQPLPEDEARLYMARAWLAGRTAPPDIPSLAQGMRHFNEATLTIPATVGGRSFDLSARVPQSFDLILDDCHFTRAGNQRVAAELSPTIEEILREN